MHVTCILHPTSMICVCVYTYVYLYTHIFSSFLLFCSKRMCVFRGIHFTRLFIEFVFVGTKKIASSNSHVILMRQTCGQCSGIAVASKCRALEFYFSVRICYKIQILKCRRESDLGLRMTSGLAKKIPLRSADLQFKNVFGRNIRRMSSDVGTALRHSLCKSQSHAQT